MRSWVSFNVAPTPSSTAGTSGSTRPWSGHTKTRRERLGRCRATLLPGVWRSRSNRPKAGKWAQPRTTRGGISNYKKSPDPEPDPPPGKEKPADREGLGRSRGGLSTKIHLAADGRCRPLGFITTVGQRHDAVAFELTLAEVAVARHGAGRPRTRPDAALADKAYSSRAIRSHLSRRGIKAVIPIKADQAAARARKGNRGGRPPSFDKAHYRDRNTIERTVNKLRAHRAVGTRYDKRDYIYRGTITVAAIRIWLRDPVPDPLQDRP